MNFFDPRALWVGMSTRSAPSALVCEDRQGALSATLGLAPRRGKGGGGVRHSQENITLPPLQNISVDSFSCLPGNFALKMAGIFGEFFWSPFPSKRSTTTPQKNRGKDQNSGQKFEKFGDFSFCDFSDLRKCVLGCMPKGAYGNTAV